ncbi:TetR-like C-terminal domain-containing protein [Streptomyces avermitilis]|uniref:TetR-like C-terminal domain-containing protein n=1 Tax=Streptomyces avermitilis TaxID=33903 RepID=UPI00201830A1|nr:TetR-like C-terminal domain-containing protein [Streptomyces avermitilis]
MGVRLQRLGPGRPRGLPAHLRRPRTRLPAPAGGAAPDAAHRVCKGITALAAAAWPHAEHRYADSDFSWSDFDTGLLDKVRPAFPELPPAAVALALRIWSHLHGLISLEIYGHLQTQTLNPDKLFREELAQLIRSLSMTPQG